MKIGNVESCNRQRRKDGDILMREKKIKGKESLWTHNVQESQLEHFSFVQTANK